MKVLCKHLSLLFRYFFLFSVLCVSFSAFIGIYFTSHVPAAYALDTRHQNRETLGCSSSSDPTNQSLLVVLLDRSGSLIEAPSPTDPDRYSTSVTNALTDLWPGTMAVIPFAGDTTPLPILGPTLVSDPVQQVALKQKILDYPIGGDTPLEPGMQEALDLLHQQSTPLGSRVIVITDGNPTGIGSNDGPHQEAIIRQELIPKYCASGIPVSVFGLTINPNTLDGQDADHLLTDIANGTGATYTNVQRPEDLAQEVISLYAQWLHLTFTPVPGHNGDHPISVDSFVRQISIVSFRSASSYPISLIGPDGQPVAQGVVRRSVDPHYEIDNLNVSGPIIAGVYIIDTGSDPNAQVYALVSAPLSVPSLQLVALNPTPADDNKPVRIQAEFWDGQQPLTPQQGQGQIFAVVTFLVNGQPVGRRNDIILAQRGDTPIFAGQTPVYNQPGQLQIELVGIYQQVERQSAFTLQLLSPALTCSLTDLGCQWQYNHWFFLLGASLILLLVIFFMAWRRTLTHAYSYLTHNMLRSPGEPIIGTRSPQITDKAMKRDLTLSDATSAGPLSLDQIFIGRDQQIEQFRFYLERWLRQTGAPVPPLNTSPSPNDKIRGLLVLLHGRGGFGKSTLLKHYHQIALEYEQAMHVSKQIDWEFAVSGKHALFNPAPGEKVDASQYFSLLRAQLALALGKHPDEFKGYLSAVKAVDEAKRLASNVLSSLQQDDRYSWLRGLAGEGVLALLRLIPYSQTILSNEQITKSIKEAVGEGIQLGSEQVRLVWKRLDEKLGPKLNDFLEQPLRLGLGLGSDLYQFARKQPHLLFFDTYEEIDEADELLRIVMGAAGSRVGWIVAGRDNLWAGLSQRLRRQETVYGYKDIVLPQRGLSIDFSADGVGDFVLSDIEAYFTQLGKQTELHQSLPPISEKDAAHILEMTRGVPLAVRIVANLYLEKGDFSFLTEGVDSKREIVDQMVRRYLVHTDTSPEDRARLYGLAL